MDRIITEKKRDGSEELAGSGEAISPGPPGSNRLIPFPGPAASSAGDIEDAGVSPASASSFVSLGSAISPVILRLQGGFPRVKVRRAAEVGEPAARLVNQPGEEEPR